MTDHEWGESLVAKAYPAWIASQELKHALGLNGSYPTPAQVEHAIDALGLRPDPEIARQIEDMARSLADAALRGISLEVIGGAPMGQPGGYLAQTSANCGGSTSRVTLDDLKAAACKMEAIRQKFEDQDRKVFLYPGPPEKFMALLESQGVQRVPATTLPSGIPWPVSPLDGLVIEGRKGGCTTICGTREAIRRFDAREGDKVEVVLVRSPAEGDLLKIPMTDIFVTKTP